MKNFLQENKQLFRWITMEHEKFLEELLTLLIQDNITNEKAEDFGAEIFEKGISFSKLAIFLDLFSQKLNTKEYENYLIVRDKVAKGYLRRRLPQEIESLKLGINNNPNIVSKDDLAIITELLHWLEKLIDSVLHETKPPEINGRIAEFIAFVNERSGIFFDNATVKKDFLKTNNELYQCAKEAVDFYEQRRYFYFNLTYIELIALFLKMTTLMSGMFLEEELLSIYIDPITKLPNRFQLLKDLDKFSNVYLLILNIRSFSRLNVLYGYDFGDGILKKLANILMQTCAIKSYRIYGDEFAVLVENEEDVYRLYDRLNGTIEIKTKDEPFTLYFYGAFDEFVPQALESCEFALFRSDKKELLDSRVVKEMIHEVKHELTMTQKLKEIMVKDSIIPYYQPIYSTHEDNEKIIKYEVLMRLEYDGKLLQPGEFLSILLEAPFYTEFTKSILIKSFQTFANNDFTFSVNFTLKDIKDKNIKILLDTLCRQQPKVAKRLTIEIVESEALKEFELLNDFIQYFKKCGISFALDDFGSGYSNFAQFAKLDIDYIKIDGSIVQNLLTDEKMQKLLDSIIAFADTLQLNTIAEYVDKKELFDLLKNRVDMIQGYYIGKPQPILQESQL
ncbi:MULTISPECIES: EAL domain-containing protein [unclassified Nitratiruptor]|uniref:EAL domain-containing protein n=1 Tax=unclassified Nitratiruptor TaxID=2624044 RepID=UPI001915A5D0|nr:MULTISPECIES: GGDEF domain-containing phosphodiesterase [unclassified Nitratiruptor]BCD59417.1 diguanylate cyclase/phosphodiesterase [Nitratiruptor sp. YY08-10]BCD63341.1 diguanylate cyclase/phosphodiesterase [Nitratiruptor sp. YY08-14]